MNAQKKLDHLVDWVTPERVWDLILAATFPDDLSIDASTFDTITDYLQTIEDESRDPDDDEE